MKRLMNHGNGSVFLLVAVAVMPGLLGGCLSRAIKEGAGVALGPKGVYAEKNSMGPEEARPLAGYQNFQMGSLVDGFGGQTPAEFMARLKQEVPTQLQEHKLPTNAAGETCLINIRVIYYEKAGITGQAFGPFEEAVTQVDLVDKTTGKVVGIANVIGRSAETVNQGAEKKAIGVAKGVASWIQKRYPEPEKE
jgi:hypothetical protein